MHAECYTLIQPSPAREGCYKSSPPRIMKRGGAEDGCMHACECPPCPHVSRYLRVGRDAALEGAGQLAPQLLALQRSGVHTTPNQTTRQARGNRQVGRPHAVIGGRRAELAPGYTQSQHSRTQSQRSRIHPITTPTQTRITLTCEFSTVVMSSSQSATLVYSGTCAGEQVKDQR
jgi:hypothetical protein